LYLRAQILLALGDGEGASRDFAAARDEDVCPVRAPTEIIEAVRQVAAESQVPLVDYVEYAEKSSREESLARTCFWITCIHD